MAGFAERSGILVCGHDVWEAKHKTDTSSAAGAPAFQSPLVEDALSSWLQTPFPARRQSLAREE